MPQDRQAKASLIISGVILMAHIIIYITYVILDVLINNKRPVRKNKEEWLLTISRLLTIIGVLCYYIGSNISKYLRYFSAKNSCNAQCVERGSISGSYLIFASLSTFVFIPAIFRKVNATLNEDFNEDFIRGEGECENRVQWLAFRTMGLILDFDVIYTGLWQYTFSALADCDTSKVIGSTVTIFAGWVMWTGYGFIYIRAIFTPKPTATRRNPSTTLGLGYRVLNWSYHAVLFLFFVTFFPVHILADNKEPLSCADTLPSRLVLFAYQVLLLVAMGGLWGARYNLRVRAAAKDRGVVL